MTNADTGSNDLAHAEILWEAADTLRGQIPPMQQNTNMWSLASFF